MTVPWSDEELLSMWLRALSRANNSYLNIAAKIVMNNSVVWLLITTAVAANISVSENFEPSI